MKRSDEIQLVKRIGEIVGYGNMMDIASALWAESLQSQFGDTCGAHIPTCIYDIKLRERKHYKDRQNAVRNHIKQEVQNEQI